MDDHTVIEAVIFALKANRRVQATDLAERALAAGHSHPALHHLRGLRAMETGRLTPAVEDFRAAVGLLPQSAELHMALAQALTSLGRVDEALDALRAGADAQPGFSHVWIALARAQTDRGDVASAKTSLERAAELAPGDPEPKAQLGVLAARRGDWSQAERLARAALALDPYRPAALRTLSEVEMRSGRPDLAVARLKALLADGSASMDARRLAQGLLGDALDRQDKPREAFAAWAAGNAEASELHRRQFAGTDLSAVFDRLRADSDACLPWPSEAARAPGAVAGPAIGHVFLMGFMRSGTTLLEQTLAVRPDVAAMEEQEALTLGVETFLGGADQLTRLRDADEALLDRCRADYWARVRGFGVDPAGKVFLDKNPMNGVKLPLIARLFPEAKIIISLRQPFDVVLSCFKRRFSITSYTYPLLELETGARFYSAYMALTHAWLELLPIRPLIYRHEDLIQDFDAHLHAVCDHVGLPWLEEMRDIGARVRAGQVSSPSAVQLSQGLDRSGVEAWRRFAPEMETVRPVLQLWAERFGYAP